MCSTVFKAMNIAYDSFSFFIVALILDMNKSCQGSGVLVTDFSLWRPAFVPESSMWGIGWVE